MLLYLSGYQNHCINVTETFTHKRIQVTAFVFLVESIEKKDAPKNNEENKSKCYQR